LLFAPAPRLTHALDSLALQTPHFVEFLDGLIRRTPYIPQCLI
jgi:hypothetical protein